MLIFVSLFLLHLLRISSEKIDLRGLYMCCRLYDTIIRRSKMIIDNDCSIEMCKSKLTLNLITKKNIIELSLCTHFALNKKFNSIK